MELYHVFSFIMTYMVLSSHKTTKDINDPLFKAIPPMKIPTGLLYTVAFIPLLVLISNTSKFVYTEHVSVAVSYYIFVKSVMYALGNREQEPLYHMGIGAISILMLIYAGVIPRDLVLIAYGLMAGMVYLSIGSRKTSSDLIFFDILLAHLLFYFSKRAVVNVS